MKEAIATRMKLPQMQVPSLVPQDGPRLLVPPEDPDSLADAVRRLWGEPGTGSRLGRAGREAVLREWTWEAVAASTLARYDELTAAGDQTRRKKEAG